MNSFFKCIMCGSCCRKSPVSILPHEEVLLRRLANLFDLKYVSTPGYKFYDSLSKTYIAVSYVMELVDNKCVFLKENKCSIHDIYKPLICRSFPYVPRNVKYNIVWDSKIIFPTVEYGISTECLFVKEQSMFLHKLVESDDLLLHRFFYREMSIAREMEEKRLLLLNTLSDAWRRGYVELSDNPGIVYNVVNLYEFLRKYYPDLPFILGLDKISIEV